MSKTPPSVSSLSDFRPGIDKVVRVGSRCFVRDGRGELADVEVESDILTPQVRASFESTSAESWGFKMVAVLAAASLSEEGRRERIEALNVAWKRHHGDARFVVV